MFFISFPLNSYTRFLVDLSFCEHASGAGAAAAAALKEQKQPQEPQENHSQTGSR